MDEYRGPDRRVGNAMLESRIEAVEHKLAEHGALLSDLHEWIGNARGFFAVLGVVGRAVKWTAATVAAVIALYVVWRDGGPGQ